MSIEMRNCYEESQILLSHENSKVEPTGSGDFECRTCMNHYCASTDALAGRRILKREKFETIDEAKACLQKFIDGMDADGPDMDDPFMCIIITGIPKAEAQRQAELEEAKRIADDQDIPF